LSDGQSRRISVADEPDSLIIDLADLSSALHPRNYVVRRNTELSPNLGDGLIGQAAAAFD
jgi:hypothetical protein